jgi:predicted nuclease of predicted toxin-antitoxin system
MKILIDQNISQRILPMLAPQFDILDHVRQLGLTDAEDYDIFMFARANGYEAVITADDDFVKLINQFSESPKIIWIRTGNCSTKVLSELLWDKVQTIREFIQSKDFDIYEVFKS